MQQTPTLSSLNAILQALSLAFQAVHNRVSGLSETEYLQAVDDRWSPAEQLEHLILSSFPIASVMGKDPAFLDPFGAPRHQDKDFKGLRNYYYQVLQTGMKAPPRFTPEQAKVYNKVEQLSNWEMVGKKLIDRSSKWSEEDLDRKALKHPALGLISVRQMLFFTIFHTYHHLAFISE